MTYTLSMILTAAAVTYLLRMVPTVLMRKKLRSPFLLSCLGYMPYAVLGAMTVPHIFYSTGDPLTATVGTAVAVVLAYMRRSLLEVAVCAALAAYICSLVIKLI